MIRQPIISTMGHVDHGKSSILDFIRDTCIVKTEPGAITQSIGASIVPIETIKKLCGDLLQVFKSGIIIPGLLFIDTPGHEAFTSLRKRGGNIADIVILVVDINEGFKPQTLEALEILKSYKTPFVVAANKIDLISGWKRNDQKLLKNISLQPPSLQTTFDYKLYELVGKLSELGFNSERFDRIEDYTKQIAIVPTSAKTGEGIPELLMVLIGVTQKFLENSLKSNLEGNAKGSVLEVKEQKGLGCCIDVILYDGHIVVDDTIVLGTMNEPIVTKVRGLFEAAPLSEMRDKKGKFLSVKRVNAATGVRIVAPNLDNAISGMPLVSCSLSEIEPAKEQIQKEIEEVLIETDDTGIIVKADSLGSLEALLKLLKQKNIAIRKATIGNITKKDVADAEANLDKDPLTAAILGFNVKNEVESANPYIKIITHNVIYSLLDDYEAWKLKESQSLEARELDNVVRPCKIQLLKNYVFRQNNPAVVGVDVLAGKLKVGTPLMKDGKELTKVKSMQREKESVQIAERGSQLAVSLPDVTIGRQLFEEDVLYSAIPEQDFLVIKRLKKYLSPDETEVIKEIAAIYRKDNPVWGV
ncbi:translation initiation factor IF-2 [Candidatus Woesearchaeota archaeon]|nr:MAG: translation initiation factor IF-2 [Candidatus Woesearchaeota archaeon]